MKDIAKSRFFGRWLLILSVISALTVRANGLQCYSCIWGGHSDPYENIRLLERERKNFDNLFGNLKDREDYADNGTFAELACNATGGKLIDFSRDQHNPTSPMRCYKVTTYYRGRLHTVMSMMSSEKRFKEKDIKDQLGKNTFATIPTSGCTTTNTYHHRWDVCVCDDNYCNGAQLRQPTKPMIKYTRHLKSADASIRNSIQWADCFWVNDQIAANIGLHQIVGKTNDPHCSEVSSNLPLRTLRNQTPTPICFTAKTFVDGKVYTILRIHATQLDIAEARDNYKGQFKVSWPLEVPPGGGNVRKAIQEYADLEIENCVCYTDRCNMTQTSHGSQIHPNIVYYFVFILYLIMC